MNFPITLPVKIVMLGAGGTGGYVAPHLYRLAYLSQRPIQILICDGDTVEEKNLFRQNFVDIDVGQNKAAVLARRYAAAFGMEAEYVPQFVESGCQLQKLLAPDAGRWLTILLGCVDNNQTRLLCHRIFTGSKNLIYIDAGNGETTGQVVCGIRRYGRTKWRPVASLYKEILTPLDKLPSALSWAEQAQAEPQSIAANLMAATAVVSLLYNLLITGKLHTRHITYSSQLVSARAVCSCS